MNKLFPDNPHHDNYSEALGWEYLGTDEKHDYYVNHKWEYLSIVYGNEAYKYASPEYSWFESLQELSAVLYNKSATVVQAYLKLNEFLTNQKDKQQ